MEVHRREGVEWPGKDIENQSQYNPSLLPGDPPVNHGAKNFAPPGGICRKYNMDNILRNMDFSPVGRFILVAEIQRFHFRYRGGNRLVGH